MSKRRKFSENIQRFGRSLLLPIAVMAPVGMVLGLTGALVQGYMIERVPFFRKRDFTDNLSRVEKYCRCNFWKHTCTLCNGSRLWSI